ncbi:periplasmic chaperone [Roseimaritima multifibrata]|uniref:Periplasmic chaperone n=1 Tax=Roseimaritima multifibrata TaxID=1930274 RepID=A0A517MEJ7_9BACT|nr:OmpH family outer membrane protein [Roseimaritima multifibrata]QDS93315.1 periplasmic chaperone [Roseimaritima multifibrata]
MRISKSVAFVLSCLAIGAVAPVTAQAQAPAAAAATTGGHRVAVVDVARIFKESPAIKSQVEAVENELKTYDATLAGKRDALKAEVEKLKVNNVGSPEYTAQEEKVAEMESKLRLEMARKRKELSDAEARIYFENYQSIAEAVKYLASYNKINLVLRYNSEEMDMAKGESVIRGVMKNIVYHEPSLDMTDLVMQYLNSRVANKR